MPVRLRTPSRRLAMFVSVVLILWLFLVLTKPGQYVNLHFHQLQWTLLRSPNYQATLTRITIATGLNGGPPEGITITVRGHSLVSAVDTFNQRPLNAQELYADPYIPMDKLFGVIQDALDRNADDVSVSYDIGFGYPKRIRIDYNRQTYDDEVSIQVDQYVSTR